MVFDIIPITEDYTPTSSERRRFRNGDIFYNSKQNDHKIVSRNISQYFDNVFKMPSNLTIHLNDDFTVFINNG